LGIALGVPQQAEQLDTQLDITMASPGKLRVAFLYLRGTASIYLLGGKGSGADAMIAAAGGIDVGAQANLNPFTPLTPEALAQAKPDVLLVMTKGLKSVGGLSGLLSLPGVSQTPAGVNKQIIAVDDGLLLAFGVDTKNLVSALQVALSNVASS
jgi:iron complex transport system substrate-binding protein